MITHYTTYLGADPEVFFDRHGRIVGAEKVLPAEGVGYVNRVVLDGVQAELHPSQTDTTAGLGANISECFRNLDKRLKVHKGLFKVNFAQVVTVDADELASLSEGSRLLGCQPSFNIYGRRMKRVPETFPIRSTAGHIHLGLPGTIFSQFGGPDYRQGLVPLLDILVGNTSVILDRDPQAAVRRKMYGRAGEFRRPNHGIEYRTPSSFWLKSYALMDLMFSLAITAVDVYATSLVAQDAGPEADIAQVINLKKVQSAIDRNSANMALENWSLIKDFFKTHVPPTYYTYNQKGAYPIHRDNVDKVDAFLKLAAKDKLGEFLPPDPVAHWLTLDATQGWDALLKKVVG